MPYLSLVILSVCALFFYRAGKWEKRQGISWAALSILISFLALYFLKTGLLGVLTGQGLLFIAITLWRMREPE